MIFSKAILIILILAVLNWFTIYLYSHTRINREKSRLYNLKQMECLVMAWRQVIQEGSSPHLKMYLETSYMSLLIVKVLEIFKLLKKKLFLVKFFLVWKKKFTELKMKTGKKISRSTLYRMGRFCKVISYFFNNMWIDTE